MSVAQIQLEVIRQQDLCFEFQPSGLRGLAVLRHKEAPPHRRGVQLRVLPVNKVDIGRVSDPVGRTFQSKLVVLNGIRFVKLHRFRIQLCEETGRRYSIRTTATKAFGIGSVRHHRIRDIKSNVQLELYVVFFLRWEFVERYNDAFK